MFEDVKHQFDNDGYAVIEGFLSDDEVEALKNEGLQLIKDMPDQSKRTVFSTIDSESQQNKDTYFLESSDKISYFYEADAVGPNGDLLVEPEVSLNKIGHALHYRNDMFRKITFSERVKEVCFQLGYEDPVVVQSMYIFKNPGLGGEVSPHQDASFLHTEPLKVAGFWIALEDATIENGCLRFSSGSHKSGVHRRYIKNPDKASSDLLIYDCAAPFYQKSSFTPIPVPKGSCILIHGQAVHYSEPNKSTKSRHVYTFHVVEQKNTKYSEDNWIHPPEGDQFLSIYKFN